MDIKSCTETFSPWLTGFFFFASGCAAHWRLLRMFAHEALVYRGILAAPVPSGRGRKSKMHPCGLEPPARRRAFPERVQAGSHRIAQVFHRVLLALASSVGDDFPGRRRSTARRLPDRPHACCGCGEALNKMVADTGFEPVRIAESKYFARP